MSRKRKKKQKEGKTAEELREMDLDALCNYIENKPTNDKDNCNKGEKISKKRKHSKTKNSSTSLSKLNNAKK
jgi:hypothetical protein